LPTADFGFRRLLQQLDDGIPVFKIESQVGTGDTLLKAKINGGGFLEVILQAAN